MLKPQLAAKIVKSVHSKIVESTVRKMLFKIIMETTDQIYFLEDDAMATCRNFLDKFITKELSTLIETEKLRDAVVKQIALKSIDFDDNRVEVLVGPKKESNVSSLENMSDEVPSDDNDTKFSAKNKVEQLSLNN